jgi:hypothetical protein
MNPARSLSPIVARLEILPMLQARGREIIGLARLDRPGAGRAKMLKVQGSRFKVQIRTNDQSPNPGTTVLV